MIWSGKRPERSGCWQQNPLFVRAMHLIPMIGLTAALTSLVSLTCGAATANSATVLGLSHVPIAVTDLHRAGADFRKLGFTLKPGKFHADGIRNDHVKFSDGTEIELITAARGVDSVTASYRAYLERGDGPAFVALYAPEMSSVAKRLEQSSLQYKSSDGLVSLADDGPVREFFFADLNFSPTDIPGYFQHANGANGLLAVWIAGRDLSAERALLADLGATETQMQLRLPSGAVVARAMHFDHGDVWLLPEKCVIVPGHPIVGVTIRTAGIQSVLTALAAAGIPAPTIIDSNGSKTVFIRPQQAHGMWIAFRQSTEN